MIRFWFIICSLYLISNINNLFEDSYGLVYKLDDKSEPIQYLSCVNLKEIIFNKTRINLNEIGNDFNYHLRWIQKNKKDRKGQPISNETINQILNLIELRNYHIYQNKICLVFNNITNFRFFTNLLFKLPIYYSILAFHNETFTFQIMKLYYQITVSNHKEYPYSNCTKNYSNFMCLNDKIKKRQRLSKYYYGSDENGTIEINYQINQTIIDNEAKVIKECNQIDCKINIFYPYTGYDKLEPVRIRSFLYIPKLDFYLQLSGLISLFLNISIYQLIIKFINSNYYKLVKTNLIKFIQSRFKTMNLRFKKIKKILTKFNLRYFKLKRNYFKLRYFIILILLIIFFIIFTKFINRFLEQRDNPFKKIANYNSFNPEFSIVICVDMKEIKGSNYNIYNKSLLEIGKDTDNGLDMIIREIYLEFLGKKMPTNWEFKPDFVAFDNDERCFELKIFAKEPKYQSIFSVTKLIIEFNNEDIFATIFILTDNEIFNSDSYIYYSAFNFKKEIVEKSKLNKKRKCKDFSLEDNCNSKSSCVDWCINKNVYNQIKNLTKGSFIIKNHFTNTEWSNLFLRPYSKNDSIIKSKIKKECEYKYSKLDPCIDIELKQQSRVNHGQKIDLYYEEIIFKDEEPSFQMLLMDILNIQSILFNLNIFKVITIILFLFKFNPKFDIIFKLLIYLICSAGFIIHVRFIVDEILHPELFQNQFYELTDSILTPDLIFCFEFDHNKINQNHKLTYEYLDKITSDEINENKIFNKIEYLNHSNNWVKLDNKTNFKDRDNFEIGVFYFLDRKCFKIRQNIEYNRNQFYFKDYDSDGLVTKIFLNKLFLSDKVFYFFTKTKHKIQFTEINNLVLKKFNKHGKVKISYTSYEIKHEIIESDKFNLIKNPLSSLASDYDLNDDDKSFKKMINYFEKKLNLQTFKLPFKKTNLNLNNEINDDLFIQLYNDYEKQINQFNSVDQSNSIHKYQRQYAINYIESISKEFLQEDNLNQFIDFKFSLSFYRKVIIVSNQISLIKLIINLLNALSFWFNLCIFDLHNYFYFNKIRLLLNYIYKLLLKFRKKIYRQIIYDNQPLYNRRDRIKKDLLDPRHAITKGVLVLNINDRKIKNSN